MRDSLDESIGFLGENNVKDLGRKNILYKSYNQGFLD
jgi:hypothetical protein